MQLKDLIEIINRVESFYLYKGERVGCFYKEDTGIIDYLNCKVWDIRCESGKLVISLEY